MKIQILMSTYNGAAYLRTQLDSIVGQTMEQKSLLIRDDGSADQTESIIKEYQRKYSWISYYKGNNLGVQRSFFDLMLHADMKADYYAFADQDDQWLSEKLTQAVCRLSVLEKIHGKKKPLLYCGAQSLVDQDLKPLHTTVSRPVRYPSLGNALVQNICTGCTAVGNRSLISLINSHYPSHMEYVIMHDWWLYLTASCFGDVFYDKNSYIYYRQHGKNTFGVLLNRRELFLHRMKELTNPRGEIYRQAEEFYNCYQKELTQPGYAENQKQIKRLFRAKNHFCSRLSVIADRRFYRQKALDDLIFRGIVLIGKL